MNVQIKEKELYKKFLDGNNEALSDIVKNNKKNLIYFIIKYVKSIDIAEDIFQNVIVYVLENKEKYDFKYSFKSYLYIIAKSQCLNYLKRNKKEWSSLEDDNILDIEEELLEDIILSKQRKAKIIQIMEKMSVEYQQVIYLTLIEGLSYEETGKIMERSVSQIKNLLYRARVKIKKLLIEEKVIEVKNNKLIRLLLWIIIIGVISSGAVYATMKIYENLKGRASLTPTFTGKIGDTNYNSIWVGTFNIAWNELVNKYGKIEFINGNSDLVDELNKQNFKKEQLSEEDYYVKVGATTEKLKDEIMKEVKNKFDINNSTALEPIAFEDVGTESLTIYSILAKRFEFKIPFDRLGAGRFNDSKDEVEYFGINNLSTEELNKNIEVLFYNNEKEFAVKLKTNGNEEIILFKTEDNKTFEEYFDEIETQSNYYSGNKAFGKEDELKVPYIDIDTIINYDELCGKEIKGHNGVYIQNAIQNVRFTLNEKGGNLVSEAAVKDQQEFLGGDDTKYFYFDENFVVFLKEKDSELPYMSLKVDNTQILKESTKN